MEFNLDNYMNRHGRGFSFRASKQKPRLANTLILALRSEAEKPDKPLCAWTSDLQNSEITNCVALKTL